MNRVPEPHAVGPQRQGGGQPPTVDDATGRHHRHPVAHGVDDLGDERHGGHPAGVAAGLGALGDHQVAPGLDGLHGVVDPAAHVDDQHVGVVAHGDHLAGDAEGPDEDPGPGVDDALDLGGHVAGHGRQEVDPPRPVGERRHGGHLGVHGLVVHGGRPQGADPAGLGHGRGQPVVADAAHAGQHHRVLDPEELGQSCLHGRSLSHGAAFGRDRRRTGRPPPAAPS